MKRRTAALPAALLIALAPLTPWAQAHPSRPVKFVTGTASGGLPDVFARLVAQKIPALDTSSQRESREV